MRHSQVLRTPPQGWSTLAGFLAMLAVVGLAITDTHPLIPTDEAQPWTLAGVMVAAGLVGFVLARSGIGLVRSHILGAAAGAFILIIVVAAGVEGGTSGPLAAWLLEPDLLSGRMARLWHEVQLSIDAGAAAASASDTQAAGMLILGAICWTTGQFGASAIFRFDRGVPAVAAAGILLLLSVALPPTPGATPVSVVLVLALFTAFAMLILVRMQLGQQRAGWLRRHIADTGEVSRLFLRTGAFFVVLSVIGASTLTVATENTVVEGPWEDWDGQLPEMSEELSRLLALFAIRPGEREPSFGDSAPVGAQWEQRPGIAFVATDAALLGNYWWGAAWDSFDGRGWYNSEETSRDVPAGQTLSPLPRDIGASRLRLSATIEALDSSLARTSAFSAAEATSVDVRVDNVTIGRGGSRARTDFDADLEPGDSYTIDSFALDYSDTTGASGLTENALRAVPIDYPARFAQRYASVADGTIGELTERTARRLRNRAIADGRFNAWDMAKDIESMLQGPDFAYNADMSPYLEGTCSGLSTPDCVLTVRQGFCTYYATTMAMLLREMGIATRLVWGYLPGELEGGRIVVPAQALHAWPEVFFDGFGWVRFDPTPLGQFGQTLFDPPDGPPQRVRDEITPETSPDPTSEIAPETPDPTELAFIPPPEEPPSRPVTVPFPLFVMLGAALSFLALLIVATVRLRRLPRADAALAYRGIVSLATKLGRGPHPAQTELEYAATLSEAIPSVHEELYLVAASKVEASYGEAEPSVRDKGALRRAYARIRTALLRLSLRRKVP